MFLKPPDALMVLLVAVSIPTTVPAMALANATEHALGNGSLVEGGCGLCHEDYIDGHPFHWFGEGEAQLLGDGTALRLDGPHMFECQGVDGHESCEDTGKYTFFCDVSHDPCGGGSLLTADVDQMETATTAQELLALVLLHRENVRVNMSRSALQLVDCQGRVNGNIPIARDVLPQVVASLKELRLGQAVVGA